MTLETPSPSAVLILGLWLLSAINLWGAVAEVRRERGPSPAQCRDHRSPITGGMPGRPDCPPVRLAQPLWQAFRSPGWPTLMLPPKRKRQQPGSDGGGGQRPLLQDSLSSFV